LSPKERAVWCDLLHAALPRDKHPGAENVGGIGKGPRPKVVLNVGSLCYCLVYQNGFCYWPKDSLCCKFKGLLITHFSVEIKLGSVGKLFISKPDTELKEQACTPRLIPGLAEERTL